MPFLQILVGHLLPLIKPDEEIVLIDGDSTDGSKEYLQGLYNEGKIHHFVSESDQNQAHGWNKGFLRARGIIVKKLIDDDVHDLDAIRKCRDFMLANPDIDICISNNMESNLLNPGETGETGRLKYYRQWKAGQSKAFTFSDVTMLIRRSSLSFIGLYDAQFKMIDWEYSLRASYLGARIAYYTGCNALAVSTPGNVSSTATRELFRKEQLIGRVKYEYAGDGADISFFSRIKIWLGKICYNLRTTKLSAAAAELPATDEIEGIYSAYYQKLEGRNKAIAGEFIV
jgi:glycosyltransferase involved in cell wall biosynthesis